MTNTASAPWQFWSLSHCCSVSGSCVVSQTGRADSIAAAMRADRSGPMLTGFASWSDRSLLRSCQARLTDGGLRAGGRWSLNDSVKPTVSCPSVGAAPPARSEPQLVLSARGGALERVHAVAFCPAELVGDVIGVPLADDPDEVEVRIPHPETIFEVNSGTHSDPGLPRRLRGRTVSYKRVVPRRRAARSSIGSTVDSELVDGY